jgi:hypothetical protein
LGLANAAALLSNKGEGFFFEKKNQKTLAQWREVHRLESNVRNGTPTVMIVNV